MPRLRLSFLAAVTMLLLWPATASATTLGQRLAGLVANSRYVNASGVAVFDTNTAKQVYLHRWLVQMKPASNMKLTTAAAVLGKMGSWRQLHTKVYVTGTLTSGTLHGNVWLVGGGDPSLSTETYARQRFYGTAARIGDLATALRAAGIRHVTGRVYGDESKFDLKRTAPGWKPSYWQECPPITALSVNEDWVSFGSLYSYRYPALHSAAVLHSSMIGHGISVAGGAATGKLPTRARPLGDEASPTMSRLVRQMNMPSDNFYAEVLNKDIARFSGLTGSTWAGRYATRRYLTTNLQADMVGSRLIDGSGLSDANRLSAHNLLSLLRRAHAASYSYWFTNSLPLAGVSGTLANRMRTGPASHNARAKTGTLDDASNLSGYVYTANHHLMVFSILVNRPNLDISAAHGFQDRIVQLLAGARPL